MRIGFLILNLGVRGSVRRVVELSNRLVRRGHRVTVYHSDGSLCAWLPLEADTWPQHQVVEDELDALIFFCDPVHYELVKAARATVKACYVLGFDHREAETLGAVLMGPDPGRTLMDARTRCMWRSLREFRVLANCTAIAELIQALGFDAACVPGGVDQELFRPGRVAKVPFRVLSGGAKRAIEGTMQVLQTIDAVRDRELRAHLRLYAGLGYTQEELADLYCSADVFLDAQHYGGWNNPVAEAMASGTAVVCTDIWGNRDFAVDGETALLVPVGDVEAMTAAVLRVLRDGELRRRLVRNAAARIAPFTWERATDALEEALCVHS